MRTIKELAELCNVSKPTIERTIKDLGIEKIADKNRYVVAESDCVAIVYAITHDSSLLADDATRGNTEQDTMQSDSASSETTEKKPENETQQDAKEDQTNTDQNKNLDPYTKLIESLESRIEAQERIIQNLQEENKILSQTIGIQSTSINDLQKKLIEVKEERDIAAASVVEEASSNTEPPQEPQTKKKGFFSWLFG